MHLSNFPLYAICLVLLITGCDSKPKSAELIARPPITEAEIKLMEEREIQSREEAKQYGN